MAGTYDDVIVGSGINALVCASLLAKKGRRVCVLERNDRIGGCIRTDEITLPGFRHDVLSQWYPLFLLSPGYAMLADDLHGHGLEFANTPTPTGSLMSDNRGFVLTTDREKNTSILNALSNEDGDQYKAALAFVEANAELTFAALGEQLWRLKFIALLAKTVFRQGPRQFAANLARFTQSARHWLEQDIGSDTARACFAPWVLHAGLSPDAAFSGYMAKIITMSLEAVGTPVVVGGSDQILQAFTALLKAHGADIVVNADADEIQCANGKASAVRTSDGEMFQASGNVICSTTPTQLYGRLLRHEKIPDAVQAELSAYRHGRAGMQIHIALDEPPQWVNPDMASVALIHLCDGVNSVSTAVNQAACGLLPAFPTVAVGQPTVLDPSRAPPGKSILWLQLLELPSSISGDAVGELACPADGVWNDEIKEQFADRVIKRLSQHITNLDSATLKRVVLGPSDLERLNMNLVGGDPYGGDCNMDQFLLWRPLPSSKNHDTAIKNVFLIGASTHPGPGLGGGSGYAVAAQLT